MTKINLQQLIADRDAGTDEPWHVQPGNNDEYRICFTSDNNWLAEVFYGEDDLDPEADARRIARLPDLEAAYIDAVGLIEDLAIHITMGWETDVFQDRVSAIIGCGRDCS